MYFSNWLSINNLEHDNLYDFGLNAIQYDLEELKDKSFRTLKS